MFISPQLVTPNCFDDSLQYLYQLSIPLEKERNCQILFRNKNLLILGFDHESKGNIKFQVVELSEENLVWLSLKWYVDDSLFYFAEIEECDFPLARAVSVLIKELEKLKGRE